MCCGFLEMIALVVSIFAHVVGMLWECHGGKRGNVAACMLAFWGWLNMSRAYLRTSWIVVWISWGNRKCVCWCRGNVWRVRENVCACRGDVAG